MHISHAALISTLSLAPVMLYSQPSPSSAPATTQPAPAPSSTLLQPALHDVENTLNSLKFDKWKKGSVRDQAASNANAILGDLKAKLPPLVAEADAANGAISSSIPLVKHLDALYDVLLRVEEASRVSAPSDQIGQLESTLTKFERARITLYDAIQQKAAGQEKQVADLQAAIKAQKEAAAQEKKPAPASQPPPCTPPKPTPKKKRPTPPKTTPPETAKPAQNPPPQPKPQQ
jgi:hypothetical protein